MEKEKKSFKQILKNGKMKNYTLKVISSGMDLNESGTVPVPTNLIPTINRKPQKKKRERNF
jgi:hypothetical protein